MHKPGTARTSYEEALRQSQAAVELQPDNGMYLNTLGVAQYRVGDYQAALATLTRSEQLNSKVFDGSSPPDLVFMAMVNQQLGNTDQAREQLQQVHQLRWKLRWSRNGELESFLTEAEALIEPDAPPETKAADPAIPPQPTTPSDPPPDASPEAK